MRLVVFLCALAAGVFPPLHAGAVRSEAPPITGTYDCTGWGGNKKWHFRSVNTAWGPWVIARTTYPPQNGEPADVAQTFIGFDASAKRWNIVSLDRDGSYYTRYSSSAAFNGSRWTDRYPADGSTAIVRLRNDTQYTFDLYAPASKHSVLLFHVTCSRA